MDGQIESSKTIPLLTEVLTQFSKRIVFVNQWTLVDSLNSSFNKAFQFNKENLADFKKFKMLFSRFVSTLYVTHEFFGGKEVKCAC